MILKYKIDWVGALLASAFMALLCYLIAYVQPRAIVKRSTNSLSRILSSNVYRIKETANIVILCLAAVALPLFVTWIHYGHLGALSPEYREDRIEA